MVSAGQKSSSSKGGFSFPFWTSQKIILCITTAWQLLPKTLSFSIGKKKNLLFFCLTTTTKYLNTLLCDLGLRKTQADSVVVQVHAINSSTWEAEAGRSLWVWSQPDLQSEVQDNQSYTETLSQKTKTGGRGCILLSKLIFIKLTFSFSCILVFL